MPRSTGPRAFQTILCPVDFSNNSRAAMRYATMLARLSNGHVIVMYVNDPLLATVAATQPDAKAILAATENDLRRFVTGVISSGTPRIAATLLTVAGKPSQEIVKAAERHGCDLIVMGYRGVGRASRLVFGSTTEGVVRTTTVPVLAVPPAKRRARLPVDRSRLRRAS